MVVFFLDVSWLVVTNPARSHSEFTPKNFRNPKGEFLFFSQKKSAPGYSVTAHMAVPPHGERRCMKKRPRASVRLA
jgi:hypothetical protein